MSYDFKEGQSAVEYGESLLASRKSALRKQGKRQKQIKRFNQALAVFKIGDMFLGRKANKNIELLNEKKAFDLQRRQSDFVDKTKFENIYDKIKEEGFDPLVEESYTNYFRDQAAQDYPHANTDKDKNINSEEWIDAASNNFTTKWQKDLKTWRPWLRATEKEFTEPIKQFYAEAVRDAQSPENRSLLRKTLSKLGLWKDKRIRAAYKMGELQGNVSPYALKRYTEATGNTDERLRILREGETEQGEYEELPDLIKRIMLSKKVTPELYQQLGDAWLVDKGNLYGKNIPLDPTTWKGGKKDPEKKAQLTALLSPNGANIFVTSFKEKALKAKDQGGLGWTELQFTDWLETSGGKGGWADLLYHRNTGPSELSDLRDYLPEIAGGKWQSDGPNAMFLSIWGRRAQNLFDIEKQQKGLDLPEGANPADWTSYIEKAFTETIRNNLTLREDGRLEIVENQVLAYSRKKNIKEPGDVSEEILNERGGSTNIKSSESKVPTLNSKQLETKDRLSKFTITTDKGELTGGRAVIFDSLHNRLGTEQAPDINSVRSKINKLKILFPEDEESMNNILIDFLDNRGGSIKTDDSWEAMSWEEKAALDPERVADEASGRSLKKSWSESNILERASQRQARTTLERFTSGTVKYNRDRKGNAVDEALEILGLPSTYTMTDITAYLLEEPSLLAKR